MNNRIQQRFDRSINDAIEHTRRVNAAKPRRDVTPSKSTNSRTISPKGRLYLDTMTGATIWEPAALEGNPTGKGRRSL